MVASSQMEVCRRSVSEPAPATAPPDDDLLLSLMKAMPRIPDARKPRGKRYDGASLLSLAVCAMLCGARSVYAVDKWGSSTRSSDLRSAMGFTSERAPSLTTVFRALRDVDPAVFEHEMGRWLTLHREPLRAAACRVPSPTNVHRKELPGARLIVEALG